MKISWKYAKVLLQFQNGLGPRDSSNIMLRSQKNVAAVCCAFHIHTDLKSGSKFAATALNMKMQKKLTEHRTDISTVMGVLRCHQHQMSVSKVCREKKLIMTLTHSVWQAHDFAAYDICPPGPGSFLTSCEKQVLPSPHRRLIAS